MDYYEMLASTASAKNQMAFQERMSNTAHVREVRDLKAAGLNPVLSAGGSGASTPTGAEGDFSGAFGALIGTLAESVGSSGKSLSKALNSIDALAEQNVETVESLNNAVNTLAYEVQRSSAEELWDMTYKNLYNDKPRNITDRGYNLALDLANKLVANLPGGYQSRVNRSTGQALANDLVRSGAYQNIQNIITGTNPYSPRKNNTPAYISNRNISTNISSNNSNKRNNNSARIAYAGLGLYD